MGAFWEAFLQARQSAHGLKAAANRVIGTVAKFVADSGEEGRQDLKKLMEKLQTFEQGKALSSLESSDLPPALWAEVQKELQAVQAARAVDIRAQAIESGFTVATTNPSYEPR